MSAGRFGKAWADVDEDEDEVEQGDGTPKAGVQAKFETKADAEGIKLVIEYVERGTKTYKVTKKMKVTVMEKRVNAAMEERKSLEKFGKALTNDPKEEAMHVKKSEEDVYIELTKKVVTLAAKDDVEDKFMDEAIAATSSMFKEKKSWADTNKDAQKKRDLAGDDRPSDSAAAGMAADKPAAPAAGPGGKGAVAAYVPPSQRLGKDGGKGKQDQNQEASLRITNLSEDAKEGDLQILFGKYGRLQRVYIAKDRETMQPRGFAFITYYNKVDAQRAIDNLHGHGYDNLILQVSFAKPKI